MSRAHPSRSKLLAQTHVDAEGPRRRPYGCRHAVSARVGDATAVPADLRPLAGVFSCFGLQQMPQPPEVLRAWLAALAPDGILALCYWPPPQDQQDPAWRALTADPSAAATATCGPFARALAPRAYLPLPCPLFLGPTHSSRA